MSEAIPESIPTSQDPRSKRPIKKRALTPVSAQAAQVDALFAHPEKEITLPSGAVQRTFAAPPEIVANVQGSSAGAGSGEFHVYKASRRREYERLRLMDEEVRKEEQNKEFEKKREEAKRKDSEKTSKNRARRERQKLNLAKQKAAKGGKLDPDNFAADLKPATKKLGPKSTTLGNVKDQDEDEDSGAEGHRSNPEEVGITIHDDD